MMALILPQDGERLIRWRHLLMASVPSRHVSFCPHTNFHSHHPSLYLSLSRSSLRCIVKEGGGEEEDPTGQLDHNPAD